VSHRRRDRALAAVALYALLGAFPAVGQERDFRQQDVPSSVPEHYVAGQVYVQGRIYDVADGGMTLMLEERSDADLFGPFGATGGGGTPADSFDSFIGIEDGGLTLVTLARVQGWLFIDDPEGGPQQRIRLIEARDLFEPGQIVQIGRAPGMPSSASHAPVSASGRTRRGANGGFQEFRTRKRVALEGWVYVRLNRMEGSDEGGASRP
jgi:hypothetical protein